MSFGDRTAQELPLIKPVNEAAGLPNMMGRRFKRMIQFILVIAISFFILAPPVCLRYTQWSEAKFLSPDLAFENPDRENRPTDNENTLKVFGPVAFFILFILGTDLFVQSSRFFSQSFSLRHKTFCLRC